MFKLALLAFQQKDADVGGPFRAWRALALSSKKAELAEELEEIERKNAELMSKANKAAELAELAKAREREVDLANEEVSRTKALAKMSEEEKLKDAGKAHDKAMEKLKNENQLSSLKAEKKYVVEITQLKKRLNEAEMELSLSREEKNKLVDEFERSYLARKLQQVIKLQVLAPRVSVTI